MTDLTGILIRHNGGHDYVGEPSGAERFFKIDTDDPEVAVEMAEKYLDLHGFSKWETVSINGKADTPEQTPGQGYYLGDRVANRPVRSMVVTMDTSEDERAALVALELGDPIEHEVLGLERRLQRISVGADSRYASPDIEPQHRGRNVDKTPPPYSLGQVLYPSRSPAWSVPSPFWVAFMEVTLEEPGWTDSLIRLWRNGEMISQITLKAGEKRNVVKVQPENGGAGFLTKDFIIMEIKIAGGNAANLAVFLRGAVIQDNTP